MLHLFAPPFGTPQTVIFCRILRCAGKQKLLISFENQEFTAFCFSLVWCHQESNRGHKDFQSFALPTELWHLAFIRFASAKVEFFSYSYKLYGNFFTFQTKIYLRKGFSLRIRKVLYIFWRIFATLKKSIRIVAQLVAHYVRDVGVGRSSRLYPT